MTNSETTYYYVDPNGQPVGPYNLDDLKKLQLSGGIKSDTQVAKAGDTTWQPFSNILTLSQPEGQPTPALPATPTNAAEIPKQINVIGILSLISGIFSVLCALSFLLLAVVFLVVLIGVLFLVPAAYLGYVGIMNILYGSKLVGSQAAQERPKQHLAILDIVSVVFGNFVPCVLGIIVLVFSNDDEVKRYYKDKGWT